MASGGSGGGAAGGPASGDLGRYQSASGKPDDGDSASGPERAGPDNSVAGPDSPRAGPGSSKAGPGSPGAGPESAAAAPAGTGPGWPVPGWPARARRSRSRDRMAIRAPRLPSARDRLAPPARPVCSPGAGHPGSRRPGPGTSPGPDSSPQAWRSAAANSGQVPYRSVGDLGQRLGHHLVHGRGQVGAAAGQCGRRGGELGPHDRDRLVPAERRVASQHVERGAGQRVLVGAPVHRPGPRSARARRSPACRGTGRSRSAR